MKKVAVFILKVIVWIVNLPFALLSSLEYAGRWCRKISDALVGWFFRMEHKMED